ncbi:MAG: hypothetical protein JNL12_00810 [Planctomycetes bacterium]|nr:hypothetical protein [Planctomycetota bacterium]
MTPKMSIRVATAALVGAMFLPAQSLAEGRRPAAKATASAAERAQVRLAEVMAMLQDDTLSPEQRAEATRKLEEVMAALAAAKAAPVAGQPAQSTDSAKASEQVVVVRSSRDSSSAQDSQSSSSSSSSGSGSSRSDTAKATDESSGRAKGKRRARTVLMVPGAAAETTPAPTQQPEPPAPDSRIPTPPKSAKAPKAPKAPKPPKAPRATGALPDAEPPPPPAEGSVFEVSSLEPGTFLLSTEPPEGMTAGVSIELAEPMVVSEGMLPLVISEEHLVESSQPDDVTVRVRAQGVQPLVLESLDADGNRARLLARVLEMRRAQVDQARELVDVELHGTMQRAKADLDLAKLEIEVAQRAMAEAKEHMLREVAAATEAQQELDADRVAIQRAVERKRAADERAAAERDLPPSHVERHTFEVQKKQARTSAQDAEIRALVEEMRAEMREIRALMREMRAHAGAAPAAGDRLLYVDERRVETTDAAIEAAKDAQGAGRPVRLRWAGEKAETRATEAAPAPRVRWLRAEPAPKSKDAAGTSPKPECEAGTAPKPACEEEEVRVSTSVGVATFPALGGR